jgi:hypothetical protein
MMASFFEEHSTIITDRTARHPSHMRIRVSGNEWNVEQTLVDPQGNNDHFLTFAVDTAKGPQDLGWSFQGMKD